MFVFLFLKILFIYLRDRGRGIGREKQALCREPDVGIDPGTPGSRPGPKADTQPLSHSGAQHLIKLVNFYCFTKDIIKGTWSFLFSFLFFFFFFFKILCIYSWETQGERKRHRQREKQAPCREPDVGLDPGTPGSRPGPKADVQLLTPPYGRPCTYD